MVSLDKTGRFVFCLYKTLFYTDEKPVTGDVNSDTELECGSVWMCSGRCWITISQVLFASTVFTRATSCTLTATLLEVCRTPRSAGR